MMVPRWFDRWPYVAVALFSSALAAIVYWWTAVEHHQMLERYRAESAEEARSQAASIETHFALVYQGLRTIARLPGVRAIDRYGRNFDAGAKRSAQEIYNNLALSVAVSEVYTVPADFDPDAIDTATGEAQEPIIQFDHLIEGRTAASAARGLPSPISADSDKPAVEVEENPNEIEIFEYRQMRAQYRKLAQLFGNEASVRGFEYPAISSNEVITCDNSRSRLTDPTTNGDRASYSRCRFTGRMAA